MFTPARLLGLAWISFDWLKKTQGSHKFTVARFVPEILNAYLITNIACHFFNVEMDPFLCYYLLLWLRSLSEKQQAVKPRCRHLQEARRRISRLQKQWQRNVYC